MLGMADQNKNFGSDLNDLWLADSTQLERVG